MTAGDLPLVSGSLRLTHRRPAEIVALFAREQAAGPGRSTPRAARAGVAESLLPAKVDALLRGSATDELVLVGTEDVLGRVGDCIRELDVPVERLGPDRERITLTLRAAVPTKVRRAVLKLPGAGQASFTERRLTLEGSPEWLHRALRQVIRLELLPPEKPGPPSA